MSESDKKKSGPGRENAPGRDKATGKKPPAKDRTDDSDDIERAVYDGMQDLRVKKPR